jgi:hypothetical protein
MGPAGNTAQFVSGKGQGCDVIFIDKHALGEMKNSQYFLSQESIKKGENILRIRCRCDDTSLANQNAQNYS